MLSSGNTEQNLAAGGRDGVCKDGSMGQTHIELILMLKALLDAGVLIKGDDVLENIVVLGHSLVVFHLQNISHSLL